jgi:hypothetical protein
MLYLPVRIIQAVLRFDFAFISGFFSAASMFPAILNKRREELKNIKLRDRDILKIIE